MQLHAKFLILILLQTWRSDRVETTTCFPERWLHVFQLMQAKRNVLRQTETVRTREFRSLLT
ncbi:hypothetical protein HOLleu_18262 [Holothuria leucospilota]|uniref:Uncharacterized protein n=1 Tax=Holothuria leucospilota TaxID=206669 RepID=A0A9Q1C306_HOLLE|nr:hypothetical protein HOLleu_18262 [Holothuria leucospilota]